MATIEELQKKLYRPGENLKEREDTTGIYHPGETVDKISVEQKWGGEFKRRKPWQTSTAQNFFLKRGLQVLAVLLVLFGIVMLWRTFLSFDKSRISLEIFGPERIISGEEINYIIRYKNKASVGLENIHLSLELPNGGWFSDATGQTKTLDINKIAARSEGQAEFKVHLVGLQGTNEKVTARLNYRPINSSLIFENTASFVSSIISTPLVLDFDLPKKIVGGQDVNFSVRYLNVSDANFSNLKLKLEYPTGFEFTSSLPKVDDGNNIWLIDKIGSKEEGKIIFSGKLSGQQNETKSFKARLGITKDDVFMPLAEGINSTQVALPPLNLSQTVNGLESYTANVGETLHFKIKYQNTADVGINGVVITANLDSLALDFSSVKAPSGIFNSLTHTITWNAATLRSLEILNPQMEGELQFEVRVKDRLPINGFDDKNFTVNSTVKINSTNVPSSLVGIQIGGESKLEIKLNSKLILNTKVYFQDNFISNSGPIPLKVDQMTTYSVHWEIVNVSNDLDNVQVVTYLPSYIHWVKNFKPDDADIKYEPSTGKIIWNVGRVPAATGVLLPVKYVAFQIGLVPSLDQLGNFVDVIKESTISGRDSFTEMDLTAIAQAVDSTLPDDPTVGWDNGRVAQ